MLKMSLLLVIPRVCVECTLLFVTFATIRVIISLTISSIRLSIWEWYCLYKEKQQHITHVINCTVSEEIILMSD